jgi:MarR family transcriptional regulator for hemolysin
MAIRARNKELSQYGITSGQAAVLLIIKLIQTSKGEATTSEISRWLLREPHSVSRILTRMQNEGLLNKNKGSGKKNELSVILTEKGEQAYKQSLKRESIREIMSCLSEEERRQLDLFLERLRDKAIQSLNAANKVLFP